MFLVDLEPFDNRGYNKDRGRGLFAPTGSLGTSRPRGTHRSGDRAIRYRLGFDPVTG
jgi:hypothetical protein